MNDKAISVRELKKAIWDFVGRTGTVITNGNLDWVIEQALKGEL